VRSLVSVAPLLRTVRVPLRSSEDSQHSVERPKVERLTFETTKPLGDPLRSGRDATDRVPVQPPTRCSTILSSNVNLSHAIDVRALCDAALVTYPSKFGGTEPLDLHLADGVAD